jgi:hypothetical protein
MACAPRVRACAAPRASRPGNHDQVPAKHNERHRGQRPGYHDKEPREPTPLARETTGRPTI